MNATPKTLAAATDRRYIYTRGHEQKHSPADYPVLSVERIDSGNLVWSFDILGRRQSVVLGLRRPRGVTVKMHTESFAAYVDIAPFFALLGERRPDSLEGVEAILNELGFADATNQGSEAA